MNLKRLSVKPLIAAVAIAYLILDALTFLTSTNQFIEFLRIYVFLVNTVLAGLAIWALLVISRMQRPRPLPELEKEFEEELKRLVKEWEEVKKSEGGSG